MLKKNENLDATGKFVLDSIYNEPDPRPYFSTLRNFDYLIPQFAKPLFRNVIDVYREVKHLSDIKIVDLGCSYGVNAALLRCDMSMPQLYELYDSSEVENCSRSDLVERDRKVFSPDDTGKHIEVIGIDAAEQAVGYAEEAGIVDDKIVANLEENNLTRADRALLVGADLIISTGCVGYISEKTIGKIMDAAKSRRPWMVHFVLRMFPYEPIAEALASKGYVTAKGTIPYLQRRFASREEQERVLDRLIDLGIDPSGLETEGWYYADVYVSRPAEDAMLVPAPELIVH